MPSSSAKFLRGHDLAARDTGHVRDDGFHLGNAVVAEELSDLVCHLGRPDYLFLSLIL
jgi:hypothetical protein